VNGFTLPDELPRVAAVEALPDIGAVLTLEDGSQLRVGLSDRPALTPPSPEDLALLIRWADGPDAASAYRVPVDLAGRMAWALGCRPHFTPTLASVRPAPDVLHFEFWSNGASRMAPLTVPRDALMHLGIPVPRAPGQPVTLTITDQDAAPEGQRFRVFFFAVFPEDPDGAACLEALGLTERVGLLNGEGVDL